VLLTTTNHKSQTTNLKDTFALFTEVTSRKSTSNGKQRRAVVVDMDGTIADASRREAKFLRGKKKNWLGFFKDMEKDPPIKDVLDRVMELSDTHDIVILTGRPEKYRPQTESWLRKYKVPAVEVLMRHAGDTRRDFESKSELMKDLIGRRNVVLALDDRKPVVELYRKLGVNTVLIQSDRLNQVVNETYRLMEA
jgi:hypothetical protein